MDPLARLFGSPARLKLLRLFLFNDDSAFSLADAVFRIKAPKDAVRKELSVLTAAEIIRKRTGKMGTVYGANKKFPHYEALQTFVRNTTTVDDADILNSLKKAGTIRIITLSGLFTGSLESKVDLFIVGDKIEEKPLAAAVHALEAELGRELRFAAFTTQEFRYRLGVYDRLLRDLFDFPHRTILDRLGLAKS